MIMFDDGAFDMRAVPAELSIPLAGSWGSLGATVRPPPLDAREFPRISSADSRYDVIVIGSGFGGAMAAHAPALAGARVLMLERGGWVERGPHNWEPGGAMELTPFYSRETPVRVHQGRRSSTIGLYNCVGGQSVFSGAVALRFRERDFTPDPQIAGASEARWPFGYDELEPYYTQAERLLDVAGETGVDPTEPRRAAPYPHPSAKLSTTSGVIEHAARELGLHPFRLPLAINYQTGPHGAPVSLHDV